MKKWIAFVVIFFAALSVKAQYMEGPDRYFYDEEFDWRWDVRVRISDGVRTGYLTNREANRLYRRLENIERKEWAFQSDGYYSPWEQDEIWLDVVALNRAIGLELSDWDRRYYGYTGIVITGPLRWYFGSSYDFYRFDRRGYGTIRVGYMPRNYYPVKHVYYTKRNNYTTHWNNRPARVATPARNSNSGSREYSNRNTQSSRSAAPSRSSSGANSRVPERAATPQSRVESSRSSAPERTSGRVETQTRSSRSSGNVSTAPGRTSSVERGTSSQSPAPKKSSVERNKSNSKSSGVSNRSASSGSSAKTSSSSRSTSGSRSRG